ncbi:hypothetical protein QUF90_00695, partial [Desulfococcaceae bacterium HSG9]|nr:hypothetical protein [Desulfococcaceae bacterium HSG9]
MLGIIKKKAQKARSIIKKTNHNATESQQVNSGWKEIASAPKESVVIHKETASGWDLITKGWQKTPQPPPTPKPEIEKKSPASPVTKKPASTADTRPPATPEQDVKPGSDVKPKPSEKAPPTTAAKPDRIGRPSPVSEKTAPLQSPVKPQVRPSQKREPQSRLKQSLAKAKERLQSPVKPQVRPSQKREPQSRLKQSLAKAKERLQSPVKPQVRP